ncbi:MAG: CPBP family intramembrane metalloprotease [Candidatus Omnitrophota bacterium]|nr:MAG: CPBP family intramembrane metalloprotease [Candidatus Omnitrophota bacterium]
MNKNIYIWLSLFCLAILVAIHVFLAVPQAPLRKAIDFEVKGIKIPPSPYGEILIFLLLVYGALFLVGLGNIIVFAIRKMRKKPLMDFLSAPRAFPLSGEQVSQLFFLIAFFIFTLTIGELHIIASGSRTNPLAFSLFMNLFLQLGVIMLILKFFSARFLDFTTKKSHFYPLFQLYTVTLPFTLGALILNRFILEAVGISPTLSPAMELIFLLQDKRMLVVLFLEIVFIGPLAEEIFFRGFIYTLARKRFSFVIASLLVSLLFAFLHRAPLNILPLFVISLSLCYLYEKTQSILAPIIFHSFFNFFNLSFVLLTKGLI